MPIAARSLAGIGGVMLLGWGAWWVARPAPAANAPQVGTDAPVDSTLAGPWVPVARLEGDAFDIGPITALDARDDTLFVSHTHGVSLFVRGERLHSAGDSTPGAPQYVGRGSGIARTPTGVAQLDARRHALLFWSATGHRLGQVALPTAGRATQYGGIVAVDSAVVVAAFQQDSAGGAWWLWRVTTSDVTPWAGPIARGVRGAAYHAPLLATLGERLLVMDALDGRLQVRDRDGAVVDSGARRDAPRLAIPERSQRRLQTLTARLPEPTRLALALDGLAPYATALGRTPDGRLLVQMVDTDDASHVEVLTPDGQPIGRLWHAREPAQVFLADGRVFRVRDADESLVIERLSLSPPRR